MAEALAHGGGHGRVIAEQADGAQLEIEVVERALRLLRRRVAPHRVLEERAQPGERFESRLVVLVPGGQPPGLAGKLAQLAQRVLDVGVGRTPAPHVESDARRRVAEEGGEVLPGVRLAGLGERRQDVAHDLGKPVAHGVGVAPDPRGDRRRLLLDRSLSGPVAPVEGGADAGGPAGAVRAHRREGGLDGVPLGDHPREPDTGVVDADPAQRGGALVVGLRGSIDRLDAGRAPQQFRLVVGEHGSRGVEYRLDGVLAQQAQAQRVHRPDRRLVEQGAMLLQRGVQHHRAAHPLAHLGGGRLGEGDRRDLRDRAVAQQPQVALDQHAGLAAARAGRDREVRGVRLDDRSLLAGQVHCLRLVNWLTRQIWRKAQ